MKKVIVVAAVMVFGMMSLGSCKKLYHCHCSFNNKVVFSKDLGGQHEDDAQEICSSYDTTITGEVWNCTIY